MPFQGQAGGSNLVLDKFAFKRMRAEPPKHGNRKEISPASYARIDDSTGLRFQSNTAVVRNSTAIWLYQETKIIRLLAHVVTRTAGCPHGGYTSIVSSRAKSLFGANVQPSRA